MLLQIEFEISFKHLLCAGYTYLASIYVTDHSEVPWKNLNDTRAGYIIGNEKKIIKKIQRWITSYYEKKLFWSDLKTRPISTRQFNPYFFHGVWGNYKYKKIV